MKFHSQSGASATSLPNESTQETAKEKNRAQLLAPARGLRLLLSVITVLYVAGSFTWVGRQGIPLTEDAAAPARRVWYFLGLDQDWRLFAPEVRTFNFHPTGLLLFESGLALLWQPPLSVDSMGGDRLRQNKNRKWSMDSLPWQIYRDYWPDLARRVAREYYTDSNPPKSFTLFFNWNQLPDAETTEVKRDNLPGHKWMKPIFHHTFTRGELEK